MTQPIKLRVEEAHQEDVNKGIVRVDSSFMRQFGFLSKDIIGLKFGKKETLSTIFRGYPDDIGRPIIRMDGVTRQNLKVGVGDEIEIFKPQLEEAHKVILVPFQEFMDSPFIRQALLGKPVINDSIITANDISPIAADISNDNTFSLVLGFAPALSSSVLKFRVAQVKGSTYSYIGKNTQIEFSNKLEQGGSGVNYEDVGGLKSQLGKIRELVELPLRHPELFEKLGIDPPKGILLYGPPGTGKTLLARAIANESEASFYSISAPEVVNKFYGESEKKLRELFEKAEKISPSIIFIDEIDAIAAKREEVQGETEKRIVAQLLTLMDGLKNSKRVIVVAATNRPDALDEALRRPGRFDRELEIGVPKEEDRLDILKIHTRGMPLEVPKNFKSYESVLEQYIKKNDEDGSREIIDIKLLEELFQKDVYQGLNKLPEDVLEKVRTRESTKVLKSVAKITHGFVGADLSALVKEAAFNVLRRTFPNMNINDDEELSPEILQKLEITKQDLLDSLKVIRPSAMREFLVEVPNVKWTDIGGLDNLKQQLKEMVEWPLKNEAAFKRLGIKAPQGILLYGPPGTGKTLLAKAVATETQCNFIYVKGPEIISKYVGEAEKTIRKLFEKARQNSPSILFFDEFDAIAPTRMGGERGKSTDTIVNQILTEMDGLEDLINVRVLAATNRPTFIDPALLRPGRFDKLVLVDVPDEQARKSILDINLKEVPVDKKQEFISTLAQKTQGFVGADIEALVREAGLIALRRNINSDKVLEEDFTEALKVIRPSVTIDLKEQYKNIEKEMKNPKEEKNSTLSMSSYM